MVTILEYAVFNVCTFLKDDNMPMLVATRGTF